MGNRSRRRGQRGQVFVELIFALPFLLYLSGLALDLVRCAEYHMVFHHVACSTVRRQSLGIAGGGEREVRLGLARFFGPGFPRAGRFEVEHTWSSSGRGRMRTVGLHYRYPQFFRFPLGEQTKHHMEVSAQCSFPIG